jgi:hypothetical protein
MRDWLIGQGITVVGMKATGAYWKPVFYLLESQMTCWMLNLIKVQQACVGHRRGLRTPPALGGICILQPVVDGGACPWSLECRDCDKFVISGATCCIGGTNASKWRQQLGRRRHRRLRVPAL